jgi:hypothetical protein
MRDSDFFPSWMPQEARHLFVNPYFNNEMLEVISDLDNVEFEDD